MLAYITGGSSGIGKQLAVDFLKRRYTVIIIADGAEKLGKVREELSGFSNNIYSYVCDVGDSARVREVGDTVLKEHGCPDIIVNNAGFATYRTFDLTPYDEMERMIEVNLLGALRTTRYFLPEMIKRRSGSIVFVASIGGLLPITPCATYDSAKFGMVGMARTLRYEVREQNIGVHLFCPGRIKTNFHDHETFRRFENRKGGESALPVETASQTILSMLDNGKFFEIIPSSLKWKYRLSTWFPWLVEPYFKKVMQGRIRELRDAEERV